MADLSSGGVRIRRERLATLARFWWALLCAFIIYGSLGTWNFHERGIWEPTLVSLPDVIINILIYLAFGALGALALRDTYQGHWLRLVIRLAVLAVLFSAVNEVFQLYTIDRVASLTDIVSAAIGAFGGGVTLAAGRVPR